MLPKLLSDWARPLAWTSNPEYNHELVPTDPSDAASVVSDSEDAAEPEPEKNTMLYTVSRCVVAILPSYVQYVISGKEGEPRRIHRTTFLDGLRGVAAFIVVISHHCMNYYFQEPYTLGPYDDGEDPMDFTNPMQLPFFRIFFTGGAMVPIFFVISGYVLSFRQIKMIRERSFEKFHETLFSSIFRRPFRLFLPSIVGLVIFQVTNELGWNPLAPPSDHWARPIPKISWSILMMFDGIWNITGEKHGTFLQQLWTIPMEYFGSMVVFLTLIATSRCGPTVRKLGIILPLFISHINGHWPASDFLAGMLIAEFDDPDPEQEVIEELKPEVISNVRRILMSIFWFLNLTMGLLIAGWPEAKFEKDPILHVLPDLTPFWLTTERADMKGFWLGIAGTQIVWCVFSSPMLQRIFTTRLALYLGDISYAIYIVHFHLTLGMGPWIHNIANSIFGEVRPYHAVQLVAVSFELTTILFVAFWEADLFWRYIDKPSVRFAKWLETQVKV